MKLKKPIIVIEHLEDYLTKWLLIEYINSYVLTEGRLIFTNVKRRRHLEVLKVVTSKVYSESILKIASKDSILILDPQAEKTLTPRDCLNIKYLVIGGILGDHPPKGRTRKLITRRIGLDRGRNLGKLQFSIDGACYLAYMISKGYSLEAIPVVRNIEIRLGEGHVIELPYVYPILKGKPIISQALISYIKHELEEDLQYEVKHGIPREVSVEEALNTLRTILKAK